MDAAAAESLSVLLEGSPFQGYAYAYPHKTAYRRLDPAIPLRELWRNEDRRRLYFYLHVPFCEMRCGFCNLFTTAHPDGNIVRGWHDAVIRQAAAVAEALSPHATFVRGAIGGGTPTFLEANELASLLGALERELAVRFRDTPFSVEMSPATVNADKLAVLRDHGMQRASLGVQSFVEHEVRASGRRQTRTEVERALETMRASGVRAINIDLIYGIDGQDERSWLTSVEAAAAHRPEEIYLYPLYVRPLTGLDGRRDFDRDTRLALYRIGRDRLLGLGYRQVSMRLFRAPHWAGVSEPVYVCQEDGMIGLGAGARSYTRRVHYSSRYAVGRSSIGDILREYVSAERTSFTEVRHGVVLDGDEERRRYVIKSILRADGLDRVDYRVRFGADVADDLPQILELVSAGLAVMGDEAIRPTSAGLERSDVIGPWLYSDTMRQRMEGFAWE